MSFATPRENAMKCRISDFFAELAYPLPGNLVLRHKLLSKGEVTMLWTIFVILLVLWLVGLVSSYTMGGFIHLLLVLALVVLVINLLTGRSTV
jgi:hypothetical protein